MVSGIRFRLRGFWYYVMLGWHRGGSGIWFQLIGISYFLFQSLVWVSDDRGGVGGFWYRSRES